MTRRLGEVAAFVAAALISGVVRAADESAWQFDVTPYLWAAGIDGDVTVDRREVEVDTSFGDIADNLDGGGSVLLEASKGRWVNWMQIDHIATDTGSVTVGPARADLESRTTMFDVGTGRRFDGFGERSSVDVLVGVRRFRIDDTLDLRGAGHVHNHLDVHDAIAILRPRYALSARWSFSPTLSVGGGDSELVWEMSPQFEYRAGERYEVRIGYRNLDYEVDEGRNGIDISFRGPLLGIGLKF